MTGYHRETSLDRYEKERFGRTSTRRGTERSDVQQANEIAPSLRSGEAVAFKLFSEEWRVWGLATGAVAVAGLGGRAAQPNPRQITAAKLPLFAKYTPHTASCGQSWEEIVLEPSAQASFGRHTVVGRTGGKWQIVVGGAFRVQL